MTTWAEPRKAVFLRDHLTGETTQIGLYDDTLPGPENKMAPCPQGFESLGIPALKKCLEQEQNWLLIDEIGYLESGCPEYLNAIEKAMEKKHVAAAVRKQNLPFLQRLCRRDDVFLVDLDAPFGQSGCVIMASGLGKRFGGNKLMADFHGQPLIGRVLDATEGIFTQRVVVTRHEEIVQLCASRNIPCTLHALPLRSDTVRLGLQALKGIESCMFCPGDQPLLRRETIASLALLAARDPEHFFRPLCDNIPGAPVIFPAWALPELENLPAGQGGNAIIKKYPHHLRTLSISDPHELKDIDSPEDLAYLLRYSKV